VDSNDYGGYAAGQIPHPNDPSSLRAYTERYIYDKVGNFLGSPDVSVGRVTVTRGG